MIDSLHQDLRHAVRTLSRAPGFAIATIITLALAIGANTVMFSAIRAMLLRPLPFADASELVRIWDTQEALSHASVSEPELLAWRKHGRAFSQLEGFERADLNRTGTDFPERVRSVRITPTFFSLLGVKPALGRDFLEEDAPAGGATTAVLISHGFWLRALGGVPDVLGQSLILDGRNHTIVGVLPERFSFPEFRDEAELWVPLWLDSQRNTYHHLSVIGRLVPGVGLQAAKEDLSSITTYHLPPPLGHPPHGANPQSWQRVLVEKTQPVLWTLWAAVGFVLLIACANVANLFLVRVLSRQRDFAIRVALGGSRARQIQQTLVESLLLSLIGGGFGVLLGSWGVNLVRVLLPVSLVRLSPLTLDGAVLLFSLGLSVVVGLVFGLVPALQVSEATVLSTLKQTGSSVGARSRHPVRSLLVALQLALAVVLLVNTALMLQTLHNLQHVEFGFEPRGVLSARLSLPASRYKDAGSQRAFFEQLLSRVQTLPEVVSAGLVSNAPLSGDSINGDFTLEGHPRPAGERYLAEFQVVSPDYFRTMGIAVRQGRAPGSQDTAESEPVILVNEAFVRRYLPGETPLGKRVRLDLGDDEPFRTIVGVVADIRHGRVTEATRPETYVALAQTSSRAMTLLLRVRGSPDGGIASVRREVLAIDSQQPVYDLIPLDVTLQGELSRPGATTYLLGAFAALAVLLAVVGTYGVMAYVVNQRTLELGIRLALGATPAQVRALILKQGLRLSLLGIGTGVIAAMVCTCLMSSLFYGVQGAQMLTFAAVAGALISVALLACWIPSLRASRIPPSTALRAE